MFLNILLLFQTVSSNLEETAEPVMKSKSLFEVIFETGPLGWITIALLLILFLTALYIFFERNTSIRRAAEVDDNFMSNIRNSVMSNDLKGARNLCASTDSPVSRMIEKGIMRIGKPMKDIQAAIENVGNLEIYKLEKNLSTLATIAGAAPMIGFLGTVTGMILAFFELSKDQNVPPEMLAGGIYQALITTAVGLLVGIFAYVGYNYLVAKVQKAVHQMEAASIDFVDLLQEPVEQSGMFSNRA